MRATGRFQITALHRNLSIAHLDCLWQVIRTSADGLEPVCSKGVRRSSSFLASPSADLLAISGGNSSFTDGCRDEARSWLTSKPTCGCRKPHPRPLIWSSVDAHAVTRWSSTRRPADATTPTGPLRPHCPSSASTPCEPSRANSGGASMGVVSAPVCPNPWSDDVDEVFGTHRLLHSDHLRALCPAYELQRWLDISCHLVHCVCTRGTRWSRSGVVVWKSPDRCASPEHVMVACSRSSATQVQ